MTRRATWWTVIAGSALFWSAVFVTLSTAQERPIGVWKGAPAEAQSIGLPMQPPARHTPGPGTFIVVMEPAAAIRARCKAEACSSGLAVYMPPIAEYQRQGKLLRWGYLLLHELGHAIGRWPEGHPN